MVRGEFHDRVRRAAALLYCTIGFCLSHAAAQSQPKSPSVYVEAKAGNGWEKLPVTDVKVVASLAVNCACSNHPAQVAISASVGTKPDSTLLAITESPSPEIQRSLCPLKVAVAAEFGPILLDGALAAKIDGPTALYSGTLLERGKDANSSQVRVTIQDLAGTPTSFCAASQTSEGVTTPADVATAEPSKEKDANSLQSVLAAGSSVQSSGTTVRSTSDSTTPSVSTNLTFLAGTTTTWATTLFQEPDLRILPEDAQITSTSSAAPCDKFRGFLTHYMADRECTGANTITVSLGLFDLVYNSVRGDDSVFGLKNWKFSFDNYIDLTSKTYTTSLDRRVQLIQVGDQLKSDHTWGSLIFKISGDSIYSDSIVKGMRHTFRRAFATDSKFRLVKIERLRDGATVMNITFNGVGDPLHLDFLDGGSTTKRVGFYWPEGNTLSGRRTIDFPVDTFSDVSLSYERGALISVQTAERRVDFRTSESLPRHPLVASWYFWDSGTSKMKTVHHAYRLDGSGHLLRHTERSYLDSGKETVVATDVSYPTSGTYKYVNVTSPFAKRSSWYRDVGPYVLPVAYSGPFGNDSLRYLGFPSYALSSYWSAQDKSWVRELINWNETQKEERVGSVVTKTERDGLTTTITTRGTDGDVLSTTVLTEDTGGGYTVDTSRGLLRVVKTREILGTNASTEQKFTTTVFVDGKKVQDLSTLSSGTTTQINDLLNKASESIAVSDGSTTRVFRSSTGEEFSYKTTREGDDTQGTSSWSQFYGSELVGSGNISYSKGAGGYDYRKESRWPLESATSWIERVEQYTASSKQYKAEESLVPARKQ